RSCRRPRVARAYRDRRPVGDDHCSQEGSWHFSFYTARSTVSRAQTAPRRLDRTAALPRHSKGRTLKEPVLVTGVAGFIGMHVARRLLAGGHDVGGVDTIIAYYYPLFKQAGIAELKASSNFQFEKLDIADRRSMAELFAAHRFPDVVHLAAQAGVRHSLVDPHAYVDANLTGFLNVLEGCRHAQCRHLVYASSSSVYGANTRVPFGASDNVDHPLSLYGATKKANELMAHAYAHLFALPATGLRFFTVYAPWGRPDMAMWLFTEAIMQGWSRTGVRGVAGLRCSRRAAWARPSPMSRRGSGGWGASFPGRGRQLPCVRGLPPPPPRAGHLGTSTISATAGRSR